MWIWCASFVSVDTKTERAIISSNRSTIHLNITCIQATREEIATPAMSQVPSPLDSPTLKDPLECPPLRWGLIGCGRVSHDFTQALKHISTAKVVACSARDSSRAKEFAEKHGIEQAYGSYEELVNDPNVDIVYVGNVHAFRLQTGGKSTQIR